MPPLNLTTTDVCFPRFIVRLHCILNLLPALLSGGSAHASVKEIDQEERDQGEHEKTHQAYLTQSVGGHKLILRGRLLSHILVVPYCVIGVLLQECGYLVVDEMVVHYPKSKAANFENAEKIVAIGKYDKNERAFIANELLVKCPSKYEGKVSE